ncbi:hypothetical protein GALMADRAFT_1356431 [Galerina marginata CBS 339.88]|uniref:Uncharacterized protein n=1 Tax=Galerina marginata (strain CBS 339.88) TaxID=685588 RepID=A0A067SI67_GALM3|nr:hypothetical protein GALMADRAFT_1356431 [Galerina marginata CBS 339.88]
MRSFALLFAFVCSAFAYTVDVPNGEQGWQSFGPQLLKWSRVDTDSSTFAVVLTNQDRTILPRDVFIGRDVDGTRLATWVHSHRERFPTGDHFRVNLVRDHNDPNTIFAQSSEFSIYY